MTLEIGVSAFAGGQGAAGTGFVEDPITSSLAWPLLLTCRFRERGRSFRSWPTPDGQDKIDGNGGKGGGTRACDAGYEENHTPGCHLPWSTWGWRPPHARLRTEAWRSVQRQAFATTCGARRDSSQVDFGKRTRSLTSSVHVANSAARLHDRRGVRNPARNSTLRSPEERRSSDYVRKQLIASRALAMPVAESLITPSIFSKGPPPGG
jgi:hypothetical protein